jgi:hypothetical protein
VRTSKSSAKKISGSDEVAQLGTISAMAQR